MDKVSYAPNRALFVPSPDLVNFQPPKLPTGARVYYLLRDRPLRLSNNHSPAHPVSLLYTVRTFVAKVKLQNRPFLRARVLAHQP